MHACCSTLLSRGLTEGSRQPAPRFALSGEGAVPTALDRPPDLAPPPAWDRAGCRGETWHGQASEALEGSPGCSFGQKIWPWRRHKPSARGWSLGLGQLWAVPGLRGIPSPVLSGGPRGARLVGEVPFGQRHLHTGWGCVGPPSEGRGRGRPGPGDIHQASCPEVAEQLCTDCPGPSGPAATGTVSPVSSPSCRRQVLDASQDGPFQGDSALGCVPAWGWVRPGGRGLTPVLWEPRLSAHGGRGWAGSGRLPRPAPVPEERSAPWGPAPVGQLPFQPLRGARPPCTLCLQRAGYRGPDAHPGRTAHSCRGKRPREGGRVPPVLRLP